jgi:hypothetical protein
MQNTMSDDNQRILREEKIITDNEVAIQVGDKYVAENVLTRSRRMIYIPNRLLENSNKRRVLKG